MKKIHSLALVAGGLAVAGVLVTPSAGVGFTTIGGSLGIQAAASGNGFQRDVRVFNNAADSQANNNVTADPLFPGALGAPLAVWKAAHGWASDNSLASRNFDFDWQGAATGAGTGDQNTVAWGNPGSCSGGVLAFTETPIANGWRMTFCDSWVWSDGPGSPSGGQFDIQGVCTHELGHSLGLGHSAGPCGTCNDTASGHTTMCAFICNNGVSERTIQSDDQAGLQSIYGVKPADKPVITGLSGSFNIGGTLIITGTNFQPTVNVKFTAETSNNNTSIPGVVYGVATTGGTSCSVVIPATAKDGNVFIWEPNATAANSRLSNYFPIDIGSVTPAPTITNIAPNPESAVGGDTITITGTTFTPATAVNVGASSVAFSIVDDTHITFVAPQPAALGAVNVTVTNPGGTSAPSTLTYVVTNPPQLKAPGIIVNNTNVTFSWGGPVNNNMLFAVNFDGTTFLYSGVTLLNPAILATFGSSGATGAGSITFPVGNVPVPGTAVHTQMWFNPPATSIVTASNIVDSILF